jgi:hypothetical protein
LRQKIVFDRQLADLGMKLFDLNFVFFSFVVFSSPDLIRKHARQAIDRLPFPRRHLRRMNLMLGYYLLRCVISTKRLKRHRSFKLV